MKPVTRVLTVVMDGVGIREQTFGNAVSLAHTPYLDFLAQMPLCSRLKAHGLSVGLPSDKDMGNSEVGHNTLGAGRIFQQGAKLVHQAIDSKEMFKSAVWQNLVKGGQSSTLHFIGLLSDGNVHSHEKHLHAMMKQACQDGAKKIRLHILLDGRDVEPESAEVYVNRLEGVIAQIETSECDIKIASGGGRMKLTMDRYEADWSMVELGWQTHVLGEGRQFKDASSALRAYRDEGYTDDQFLPPFVIGDSMGRAVGEVHDGDSVLFFNFRGDRSIQISTAFTQEEFDKFPRKRHPKVFYAGMMQYDGDLAIPAHYLVSPPLINQTLGEHICELGLRQWACSETQKYGHVTYFWNGNRSGHFDQKLEEYFEIESDAGQFELRPWMKAAEITDETIKRIEGNTFDFGRINFPNGDMVGHTGDLTASVNAVSAVDLCIGRLLASCKKHGVVLLVTADHGNCEEMFDDKASVEAYPNWQQCGEGKAPKAKTSHSLSEVPFYIFDPCAKTRGFGFSHCEPKGGLASLANTVLDLMNLDQKSLYMPSLLVRA